MEFRSKVMQGDGGRYASTVIATADDEIEITAYESKLFPGTLVIELDGDFGKTTGTTVRVHMNDELIVDSAEDLQSIHDPRRDEP